MASTSTEELHEKYMARVRLIMRYKKQRPHMFRSVKHIERRKDFIDWYIQKHQNKKSYGKLMTDLSEILFLTEQRVRTLAAT